MILTLSTSWLTQSILAALTGRRRGDVAGARADAVVRPRDPDAQAVKLPVGAAPRRIPEDVLAVQLLGDARSGFVELRRVLHDLRAPAALGRDLPERRRLAARVDRLPIGRVDRDRVHEGVAAAQRRPYLPQRRRARRVGAVRDHENRRALP